jgi:hypothetical protein
VRGTAFFALFIERCIYHELRKVASFFERYADGQLQKVWQLHPVQAARQQKVRSLLCGISSLPAYSELLVVTGRGR